MTPEAAIVVMARLGATLNPDTVSAARAAVTAGNIMTISGEVEGIAYSVTFDLNPNAGKGHGSQFTPAGGPGPNTFRNRVTITTSVARGLDRLIYGRAEVARFVSTVLGAYAFRTVTDEALELVIP